MTDYDRIARTLAYIDAHVDAQPDLDRLAAEAGLSPFHFQRLFTRWVGVSPKKFLQYLSLERAQRCLAASGSVLDASYAAGLSGPGRLHDLFVTFEAMTPGEFKRRGEGLKIACGWADSPFGEALVLTTDRGICGLSFVGDAGRAATFEEQAQRFRNAEIREDVRAVARLAKRLFARVPAERGRLELVLQGTPWQIKVWEALLAIPPGHLVAYEQLASVVGAPTASRAVGTAVGANPVAWLVPCHRVIRKTGAISGYRWGRTRKLAMLGWEAAEAER